MTGIAERVAGAPITWGVCEVSGWGHQLPPERVLGEMASIGLGATELGPEGFLPSDPEALRELLGRHELRLVGGFHPVVLHVEDDREERLAATTAYADLLAAAGADVLVLAAAAAGAGAYEETPELTEEEWKVLADSVDRIADLAAERGLTATVHPHYGTAIERPEHVERFLEISEVPLCLDTGHLLVGGADPLDVARAAPGRVAHTHMKDVDASVAERVRVGELGYAEGVRAGMYRPLGQGDVDAGGIVRTLLEAGYDGWFVLEQDTVLDAEPEPGTGPVLAAATSREFVGRVAAESEGVPVDGAGRERAAQRAASASGEEVV